MTALRETVSSGCKVNLYLRITGKRPDGYHELDSLFWPLKDPSDTLTFTLSPASSSHEEKKKDALPLHFSCSDQTIHPAKNTVTTAYRLFSQKTGFSPALHIHLEKQVPSGAGLGGGSANAAAVLRYLNTRAPVPLSEKELAHLALNTGADVPFFLHDCPCRVRGIGEDILPLATNLLQGWTLLLLCPDIHVATSWAYAAWDAASPSSSPPLSPWEFSDTEREAEHNSEEKEASAHLTSSASVDKRTNLHRVCCYNDFEESVFAAFPKLRTYKEELLRLGAQAAVMSGSGSSLVALFRDARQAAVTVEHFVSDIPHLSLRQL